MNIKYIQKLLSRIDEIKIISKTVEIDGVVCNIAGIVRYGQKLRLVILEYYEVYRQKVEEMELSEPCEVRQQETNRSILKGRGRIEAAQPFRPIKSVFIDEMEFEINVTENRLLSLKDGESVLFLSELLRNGWNPEGIDYQSIDMLFLTSIEFAGDFDENAKLHFIMNKDSSLKEYRLIKSREENIKPYFIYNDNQLKDLISKMPKIKEELQLVSGFGEKKADKYGDDILKIVGKFN